MDENYLNIPSRQSIEAYIDTLESYRNDNDPATDYSQTYLTIKKSQIMEQVDARSRLATIENKEAIDALEERLERLEQPTKRLVPVGKQLGSAYFARGWARYPVYGNGIWVIIAQGSGSLIISRDNGKTIQNLNPTDTNDCIFVNDPDADGYTGFRRGDIIFKNNKFFICSCTTGKVYETEDVHEFTKVNIDDDFSYGFFMEDINNNLLLVNGDGKRDNPNENFHYDIYQYNENENSWALKGHADWCIDSDGINRVVKFNNKLYIIDYKDGPSILSDDCLSHTPINTNNFWIKNFSTYRLYTENNLLILSSSLGLIYSEDGENWNTLALPVGDMSNPYGIRLVYLPETTSYYSILNFTLNSNSTQEGGLYKWTSLSNAPEWLSDSTFASYVRMGTSDLLNLDGILYCSVKASTSFNGYRLFKVVNDELINMNIPLGSDIHPCVKYGNNWREDNTIITKMNDRLYIVSGLNCTYREEDIYALEDYTPTGDETNTIVATF